MTRKKNKSKEPENDQRPALEQMTRHQAEELNQSQEEFLATLSHELSSPLNSILGWLPALRAGRLNAEETSKALETIEKNAFTQHQLINDLLDVAGMVAGKHRLEIHQIEMGAVVKKVLETLSGAVTAKKIHLESSFDRPDIIVVGDAERLHQIVWNMVSNAIKFTPSGGHIEVRLECGEGVVILTVTDTGVGIPASFLPFLFDRFRQFDSSTTRKYGGLGLGLSLVRHLVELHGGTVSAESPGAGQGATFRVSLPLTMQTRNPELGQGGKKPQPKRLRSPAKLNS